MKIITLAAAFALLTTPLAAQQIGAIAYSVKSDKWGRSWGYSTRGEAEAVALKNCKAQGGRNCTIALWLENSCGALARAKGTKSINQTGVSWGFDNEAGAKSRAIAECSKRNSGDCWVVTSVCSSR